MAVRHYTDLIVWQKAMNLVEEVYRITDSFPKREIFGLTNQVRRSAVSIPSNIAEGQGRSTTADFLRYLYIARGSLQEMETQIMLAQRLKYLCESDYLPLMAQASDHVGIVSQSCGDRVVVSMPRFYAERSFLHCAAICKSHSCPLEV